MRAAPLPLLVGAVMLSRTYRAVTAAIGWYVRLERAPDTLARVVQFTLSVLVSMVKEPVFQPVVSPPRPACLTTKDPTLWLEPRSTARVFVPAASEHHLLLLARLPSTAFGPDSEAAHAAEAVTGRLSARLVPRFGAAAGGLKPSLKDGGT